MIETGVEVVNNSTFTFEVTDSIAKRMIDIQGIVPCNIKSVQDGRTINSCNFPLNSLGYRITQYSPITFNGYAGSKISISIDKNITFNGKSCLARLYSAPVIVISYIE